MSRGLWFVAGAGAGLWATARARRAAEALTTDGLRDRLHALDVGLRLFRDEVRAGRGEAEPDVRRRLGLALAPAEHAALAPGAPSSTPDPAAGTPPGSTPQEGTA